MGVIVFSASSRDGCRSWLSETARHAIARPSLPRGAAIAILSLLAGCGGTVLEMEGQICNQPVRLKMVDAKDRSAFDLAVTCGPGGGVTVSTAESSASRVMEAQAEALTKLAGQLAREAAAGVLP